jgi:hypothetical protein
MWHPILEQIHLGNLLCILSQHDKLQRQKADREHHRSKATLYPLYLEYVQHEVSQLRQSKGTRKA